ncbi:MAG: response regulator transcription factor [Lachnospiraceae bacterium]|nr:response regulator transcription factor [Lachnospiraceae bacterium]
MKHRLLLIDDDKDILIMNKKFLLKEGYNVVAVVTAKDGIAFLKKYDFSCVILDVMMPDTDGFATCKRIRELTDIPIIFLSGKASEEDKIQGLLTGADDYITKPYSLRELSARIEVNIRRYQSVKEKVKDSSILSFPPLSINLIEHKAYWNEEEIPLSNREFDLLHLLSTKPGEAFSFQEIGNKVWGSFLESDRRAIMVNISRLRKKLDLYEGLEDIIESVWSKGYRLLPRNKY